MTLATMSIGDLASALASHTGNPTEYHARQLRAQVRAGALTPSLRGGSGPTAPALFDTAGLCRAMILHTLASIGQDMPILMGAADAMKVVDPAARKADTMEPSDGVELAMKRIGEDERIFLHVDFSNWPIPEQDSGVGGFVSNSPAPVDSPVAPARAWIVLPLHNILKPILGA